VCRSCGSPWERVLQHGNSKAGEKHQSLTDVAQPKGIRHGKGLSTLGVTENTKFQFLGWQPTCKCQDNTPVPALVYDPFMGIGTTALAALRLGRAVQGSELGAKYLAVAERRVKELQGISIPRDEKLPTLRMLDLFAGAE
jgi:hypothetical protein